MQKIPPAKISRVFGFVAGNDVRLRWEVEASEAESKIATFVVQSKMVGIYCYKSRLSRKCYSTNMYDEYSKLNEKRKFNANEEETREKGR